MESVVIHLTGSAEEVWQALKVLAGLPVDTVSEETPEPQSIVSPPNERLISHKGPYSDTLCAREGCFNKLSLKQVKQGSKYCGLRCAGLARRGMVRGKPVAAGVTIVAGEGVTRGSVMSEESASRLPVPS